MKISCECAGIWIALFACVPMCLAQGPLAATHAPPGYKLAWSDDFEGAKLDGSKWIYRTDVKASSSQRPENVSVANGRLVIALRKQRDRGKEYTGGGIISRKRFHYGYYEARAKLFGGAGWHQSVWAMAATDGSTTYPLVIRTEIDGLEFDSDHPMKAHMGLIIWNGPEKSTHHSCNTGVYNGPLGFDATDSFHTYGFEYLEKTIRFYVDGDLRCAIDYPTTAGEHDLLNFWLTGIGYEVHGAKINDAVLPGEMLIDWAAFYRKEQQ